MAERIYGDGSSSPPDGKWSTAANWTGDIKPGNTDDAVFRGDNADEDTNCLCDENINVASLDVQSGYDGAFDFGDSGFSHAIGGNCTLDAGGSTDAGDATITVQGSWWSGDTHSRGTAHIILAGNGDMYFWNEMARGACTLTVSGDYTQINGTLYVINGDGLTVSGTLDMGTKVISIFGTPAGKGLSDAGTGRVTATTGYIRLDTTISAWNNAASTVKIQLRGGGDLTAGTWVFGGDFSLYGISDGKTITLDGDITVHGDLLVESRDVGETLTIDCVTNDPTFDLKGHVTFSGAGILTWTKGTGKIRLTGSNDQTLTTLNKALEDIEIEKDAYNEKVTIADGLQTDSFTGIEGRFDPNGQTLMIAGNCDWQDGFNFNDAADTLNGSDWQVGGNFTTVAIDLAANSSAGWDLDVTGTAVALGAGDVADCTAGGTEIDATDGPYTNSGGNTNWNFGGAMAYGKAYVLGGGICV